MSEPLRIGVLGAGGWGTALSILLHSNGHHVTMWEFRKDVAQQLADLRVNAELLPGIPIPDSIAITSSLTETVTESDCLVLVTPSHVVREVCEKLKSCDLKEGVIVVSCVKGIENTTLLRISEIFSDILPQIGAGQICALSGPSHAEEVGRSVPTAVIIASDNLDTAKKAQGIFMNPAFRVYAGQDILGTELGGALKNVIAIASGVCDGLGTGDNTKAALLTRGMAEITRLGVAMGANQATFGGLAGFGDLMVTCMSRHSRNRYVGEEIGKGRKLQEILDEMKMVAEGVKTAQSAHDLQKRHGVELPIMEEVYQVLFHDKAPKQAVQALMTREAKVEDWG